jgi:acyl-CoA thioesterase I
MRPIRPLRNVRYRCFIQASCLVPVTLLLLLPTLVGCAASGSGGTGPTTQAATSSPTPPPPVTYVAIGASDALGVGADDPSTQGYVPLLIAHLPKGSVALNVGVSGILLHDALQQELPEAIAFHPSLITVWLVGNDFRDCTPLSQYAVDLNTLLAALHSQTHAKVFVANTPDMSVLPYFAQEHGAGGGACVQGASTAQIRALALQWNAVIDPIILRYGDILVDLYHTDLASHPGYISSDGFHPSSQGYAQLADLFWAAIIAHRAVPTAG